MRKKPSRLDYTYASFPFDRRKGQSIFRYFARKEQMIKQSPSKIVLRNTFRKPYNKTSFLIYEHTNYRRFCMRKDSASVYISACPFQNCHFTCNSSLINKADAILMFYSHITYEKMLDLSITRQPNQIDSEISVGAYGITFVKNNLIGQTTFAYWINENYKRRRNEAVW